MSNRPARSATNAMISSGALPNVALSRPPIASPVYVASCSVDTTISRATGTIASAAEKNSTGAGTCAYSRAIDTGTKNNNQLIEGLTDRCRSDGAWVSAWLIQAVDEREEESGRPSAHQDAGQRLDAAVETPFFGQYQVAVAGRRIG